MPKRKPCKSIDVHSEVLGADIDRSTIPFYSEGVRKWRNSKKNAPYLDAFDNTIRYLNTEINRRLKPTSDGYDHRLKACHIHLNKTLAVFYEYIDSQLRVLGIMEHYNDKNRWRPA